MEHNGKPPITDFSGEYAFLSNYYRCEVELEGVVYRSVEHAYHAAKTVDPDVRRAFSQTRLTPGRAKKMSRKLEVRSHWHDVRLEVMEKLIRDKFTRHPDLRMELVATHPAPLVEGNTWADRFWGVFMGEGENHLGRILMKVRSELLGLAIVEA